MRGVVSATRAKSANGVRDVSAEWSALAISGGSQLTRRSASLARDQPQHCNKTQLNRCVSSAVFASTPLSGHKPGYVSTPAKTPSPFYLPTHPCTSFSATLPLALIRRCACS